VRNFTIGESDHHPEGVVAIDGQGVRAVEFDSLLVRAQVFRRPIEIFGLERNREDSFAGAFEILTLGARRRQRLHGFDHGIITDGEIHAPSLRCFFLMD